MHSCLKCSQGIPGLVAAWPPALCKHCNGLWCLTGASQTVHAPSCCVFLSVVLCCACVPQPPALVYMRKHLRSWFADCTASSPCSFAEQRDAMPAFSQLHPSQLQPAIETSTATLPYVPLFRCSAMPTSDTCLPPKAWLLWPPLLCATHPRSSR